MTPKEHDDWKELRDSESITLATATMEDIVREIIYRGEPVMIFLPMAGKEMRTLTTIPFDELAATLREVFS